MFSQTEKDCENMISQALDKMFRKEHPQSLEILVKAKDLAESRDWPKQNFRATNAIGLNYYMIMDYGEALKNYLEAYDIAISMEDKSNVMTVLNNIAILYFQEKNNPKAYEYFMKAYKIAKENGVQQKVASYAINLGLVLNKLGRLEESGIYIKEASSLIKKDENLAIMNDMALSENLLFKKDYKRSERIALALLPKLQSIEQTENKIFILLILSRIKEETDDLNKARKYALEARKSSNTMKDRQEIFECLSRITAKEKRYDLSLAYKDSVLSANDSVIKIHNSNLFNNGKIKFEMQNYQFELKESQEKLRQERKILYVIISSSAIILLLAFWLFSNNTIKHKQEQKISELEITKQQTEKLLLEKQLKEQETLALLEEERLKNEISSSQRQLASRMLHISSRNEMIEEIINAISQQPEISGNDALRKYVHELKSQLKNDHQWEHFFTHFEGANPGFLSRLKEKHPELIPSEIRFITYVHMNLSNKEIASILNITPHSCRKRKERLSKKLNIDEGTSLYHYISNI